MFTEILRNFEANFPETDLSKLIYYFERHIELDGDEHGPMAMQMVTELCGNDADKWKEVQDVSIAALEKRIGLWDAIEEKMMHKTLHQYKYTYPLLGIFIKIHGNSVDFTVFTNLLLLLGRNN
jgi:hypothetical protein